MGGSLRIGEFADLLGVTTKSVRHYHRVGLLPEPIRSPNGYRQYGLEAVLRALQVMRLRQLGLSLRDIQSMLAEQPSQGRPGAVLRALVADLEERIAQLQTRRARVLELVDQKDQQDQWDPREVPSVPSPTMRLILERFGEVLDDASPELLAQEQRTWAVLDALPGIDTATWTEGLVSKLEAHPESLATMRSMLAEFARITGLPPDGPLIAERFVASHDLPTIAGRFSEHDGPVSAAYAGVIRDAFTPSQRRFIELINTVRNGTAMRRAARRCGKTVLRIAVISAGSCRGVCQRDELGSGDCGGRRVATATSPYPPSPHRYCLPVEPSRSR